MPAMTEVPKPVSVDPTKLNPAPYNPRKIGKRMMQALKASIREHGFVEPVVVQKKGTIIIGGHQRVRALLDICREQNLEVPRIPAVVLDIDDRKARLLNLALNKVTGDFDNDLLSTMLGDLRNEAALSVDEILSSGFTQKEIDHIISKGMPGDDIGDFAQSVTLSLKFDTVEQRDTVKAILVERAAKLGKKPGAVVHALLTGS